MAIQRGDKLGIIGESGVGKTTVLNLLMNLVDYTGRIDICGKELRDIEFTAKQCTIINSSDPLFKLSLRDNLLLGNQISEKKLHTILAGVKATSFTQNLDTVVGSTEFNLSTGQEQRIRLARGLLQESEILLMDEPFNGIDDETKIEIIEFIKRITKDKTVILVTHNKAELCLVDHVYQFNSDRELLEEPSH